VTDAGLEEPVVVGRSLSGALATRYAAMYPARGVVNVDQPLLVGPFGDMLRQAEPVLRSPAYGEIWDSMLARMQIDLLPPAAQELVRTATTPRQDLLLGYWDEIMVTSAEDIGARWTREMSAIRSSGIGYHHVSGDEVSPTYRRWLESVLPDVTISVLSGGDDFPHLASPTEFAKILAG
jgi:pimeloyl-ACP methyl ester carboxylesterase